MSRSSSEAERITREDLEAAFAHLGSEINRDAPPLLLRACYAAGSVTAALVGVAYLLGRRSGRLRSTIVEIRRR